MINVLSLGAGVQSTAVALMSVKGELDKIDYAIFADTGWEPRAVYDHFARLRPELEAAGIKVLEVSNGNIRQSNLNAHVRSEDYKGEKDGRWANLPFFTRDNETGSPGMIRRQCTYEHKIRPIEMAIKTEILGMTNGLMPSSSTLPFASEAGCVATCSCMLIACRWMRRT